MSERQPNLLTRDDTFFGVCQALGDDFGFPPNLLRIAFGVPAILFPGPVLSLYFALGAIVLLSRLLAPTPRRKAAVATAGTQEIQPQVPLSETDLLPLPIAA